jgi:hypothetical protein
MTMGAKQLSRHGWMGLPVPGRQGCHKKTRPEAEFEVVSAEAMKKVTLQLPTFC